MSTLGTQGIRIAGKEDMSAMFDIRVSVRENKATLERAAQYRNRCRDS